MRTGPSRTSKSAAPHGHPAGSRVSQRDTRHPSTPRCESLGRRRSATANYTLTCRTCLMRRVSPPRVSLYSILGCELKKPIPHPQPAAVHMPFWRPSAGQRTTHNAKSEIQHEGPYERCRTAAAGTLTMSFRHSPGLLPLGASGGSSLRTSAPPNTPTRGVPSGHLGGELSPFLAHWLHQDGYGGGQPLVVHLRREEEVISADDGHAESGRSAEEGAQRVAAAHLGAGGMAGRGGTPACPRSSHPHTQGRKPSRERRGGSFGGSAKDAHGE